MKNSVLSSLEITDVKEIHQGIWNWFIFKANEVEYYMMLLQDTKDPNRYFINGVFHEEDKCPLCSEGFVKTDLCHVLNDETEVLLPRLTQQSENRLRWLTKTIQ